MNKQSFIIALISVILISSSCSEQSHFISDSNYREQVHTTFVKKKAYFADSSLFSTFSQDMTVQEHEALMFLYAYMPIGDVADYTGDFYLKNIRTTFIAQNEMPWGKNIPETIFRHFVLPIRVNNENLDESRIVFYEELKNRVKGLSLYDAVLEVNHWCHEKVVYTPSDSRTSSPLASVKTAYGRCGEESTFTVAALRSVGIPARQVYTPRWAHTDDNHAWVEAWVDGKWYFMGACEPEPVLNLGWFNAPAYRGMLMHTKVFGLYNGPEEVMETTDCYTEINVIQNYAPSAKSIVTIVDSENQPIEDALVEFKLYNYAEFYTVARKTTNKNGQCSLSAGKGDMLVWATKDGKLGFSKLSFGIEEQLTIQLNKKPGDEISIELDIVPPVEGNIPITVTEEQKEENSRRISEEDNTRNMYITTFYTEEKAKNLAKEFSMDETRTIDFLLKSRGNWIEIEKFLHETPTDKREVAMELLSVVSDKDLRDIPASVLLDHLNHTPPIPQNLFSENTKKAQGNLFKLHVLNPRVVNEFLSSYKSFFTKQIDALLIKAAQDEPQALVDWVGENIKIQSELNPQNIPVMPIGIWKSRIADTHSRNIYFVTVARSLGIPARIEPITKKVQYFKNEWIDVDFKTIPQTLLKQGHIVAAYNPIKALDNPKYYSHFTIAKVQSDGQLQTLNFDRSGTGDMGLGNSWEGILKNPLLLDEGYYLLVSGNRMASGKVLARITSFNIKPEKTTSINLVMRENIDDIQIIGEIDAEAKFNLADNKQETTILNTTGRGYFIIGVLGPHQEPTNHAMRDIAQFKKEFEQWNRSVILLFKNEQSMQLFDKKEFGDLPETITYGIEVDNYITDMLVNAMKLPNKDNLPIFIIADTFGRVVFVSQGYTIGLGEQMMQIIHKL